MGGRQTKREQQTAAGSRQSRAESRQAGKRGRSEGRQQAKEIWEQGAGQSKHTIQMQSQNPKAKRQKPNANAMKKAMANGNENGNGRPKLGVSGRKGHAITGMWLRPGQQQQTCVPKGHNVLPDECGPRRPRSRPRRDGLLPCWLSQTLKCRTDV